MKDLTIFFPFYNQLDALKFQLDNIMKYPKDVLDKLYLIIVDDGSQKEKAFDLINNSIYLKKIRIKLLRINVDIPWNTPEANNFGFSQVKTEIVLRLDIDHFLTVENIRQLLKFNPDRKYYYIFKRINNNKKKLNSNPNIYLIHKLNLVRVKGYNEYFSGNYGDDIEFIPRLKKIVKYKVIGNIKLNWNNYSANNLSRDISVNMNKLKNKKRPHLVNVHKDKYLYLINNYNNIKTTETKKSTNKSTKKSTNKSTKKSTKKPTKKFNNIKTRKPTKKSSNIKNIKKFVRFINIKKIIKFINKKIFYNKIIKNKK